MDHQYIKTNVCFCMCLLNAGLSLVLGVGEIGSVACMSAAPHRKASEVGSRVLRMVPYHKPNDRAPWQTHRKPSLLVWELLST
jgi:hypothetical protein